MKSEVLDQLEHYFWEAEWYTLEPVESMAGNLNVVSEDSEGIWLEAVEDSAVAVHNAIADAMIWVIVLRYRRVRDICFPLRS
jgi:hypothetical protein